MNVAALTMAITPATAKKSLTLLGSTGTIGQNTLKIIEASPGRFSLHALTAGRNVSLLAQQARKFAPKLAVIADESQYLALKEALSGTGIETAAGYDAVADAAALPCDMVVSAIVGAAALRPTLSAIRKGTSVALANKECLVCAGQLVMKEAARYNATLIPVDSEHSAIFQLMGSTDAEAVQDVTITASGGPFRTWSAQQMQGITPAQAVKHPNWAMGAKISVDSATLMNKGLELIEAFHLFPFSSQQLKVLVHPQSIVHCLIRLTDGSVLAQMSMPDMCTPIACALSWPGRMSAPVPPLDLAACGTLSFEMPDTQRFPALRIAREAMEAGGSAATVLNAANEVAVRRFLEGEIGFLDIVSVIEKTMAACPTTSLATLDDVLACDRQTRHTAEKA
jgi:1-deoxy-D-xylulose-5-phosphate reductoisomerase